MRKDKLITALLLCCALLLPANARVENQDISNEAISNETYNGSGGAYYNNITSSITDTVFEDNSASVHGGAIYNEGSLEITNGEQSSHTIFIGNNSHAGGAITSLSGSTLTIGNYTSFKDNYTSTTQGDAGGALYVSDSTLTIGDNVSFTGNTALSEINPDTGSKGAAGAVYVYNSGVTIGNNVTFDKNESQYAGGGLYVWNPSSGTTIIGEDATFTENSSKQAYGGAIGNFDGVMTIGQNATFNENYAGTNGGAIANMNFSTTNATLNINGADFTNNKAGNYGGAVYNEGTANISNSTFTGNSASTGGAIYNTSSGNMTLTDVTVNSGTSNGSNSIYTDGVITAEGTNNFGSSIEGSSTGSIINNGTSIFSGNNSEFKGSYTHGSDAAITTISGTSFGGNTQIDKGTLQWNNSNQSGGTLSISDNATLIIGEDADTTGNLYLTQGSTISGSVNTIINENSSLSISGGDAVVDSADSWNGKVLLSSGNLTINGDTTGLIQATGGTLNLSGSNFTMTSGSSISSNVNIVTDADDILEIGTGVTASITNVDNLEGTLNLTGGTLNYGVQDATASTKLDADTGWLNLIDGSYITIKNPSSIEDAVIVDIQNGATVTMENGTTFNLDGGTTLANSDKWSGSIVNQGGTLNINNLTSEDTASLTQADGDTNIKNESVVTLDGNSSISGGTLTVENSILEATDSNIFEGGNIILDSNSQFIAGNESQTTGAILDSLTTSGLINTQTGFMEEHTGALLSIGDATRNQADFTIDILARSNENDSHWSDNLMKTKQY